jgi:Beta-ketoacyl synthase, N-terminal domain
MAAAVRIAGLGVVCANDDTPAEAEDRGRRLHAALAALAPGGPPIRLLHAMEEMAVLAAHEALSRSGISMPYRGDDLGVALGVEEGIDGIKARYYQGVLKDGPLGASPLTFPLTTPNTIAARISILFDLRGETFTVGGGGVSGGQAMGLAVRALREERCAMALAGGVTCVEQEFLEATSRVRHSASGPPRDGACLLLLAPPRSPRRGESGQLLGYGEGFGARDLQDAIQSCLENAGIPPQAIGAVRAAAVHDWPSAVRAVGETGVSAEVTRSPSADLHSASFPLAVAEVVAQPANVSVLVIGSDCLAGAVAAVVRGGA